MAITAAPREAPSTATLLDALDPEQRAAAVLPDGPALIIAPAGSGKTTTLIARLGVLLARGVAPERIAVATFNREAAHELAGRIQARLAQVMPGAGRIEVRTLHALARQVVVDSHGQRPMIADRLPLLRSILRRRAGDPAERALPDAAQLDTDISAWKVEGRPPPRPDLVADYAAALAMRDALDFDDLVAGAVELLDTRADVRARWQARFSHVCVDEFQDVDAGQLRLVRLLAAPQDNVYAVGDDDQTIYAWRLADVRRILTFGSLYPSARRVQLATNYRCPPPVVALSRRLIEHNRERFAKRIDAGASASSGGGPSVAAFDTSTANWNEQLAILAKTEAGDDRSVAFLARTAAELQPVMVALVRASVEHASPVVPPVLAKPVRQLVEASRALPAHLPPFEALLTLRSGFGWRRADGAEMLGDDDHAALDALLGWSVGFRQLDAFLAAQDQAVGRVESLRRPAARVELLTVHGAKGREWETVVVLGMERDRFPNRRALTEARDPDRALEEERRLAYVALTRATRRLILAYDPRATSPFLVEVGVATG